MLHVVDNPYFRACLAVIILASLKFFSGTAFGDKATIKIRQVTNINQVREIKLGDVAEFDGLDEDKVNKLSKLSLGMGPKAGERRTFNSLGLSQVFRYHMGGSNSKLRLTIPSEIVIENLPPILNEENVQTELSQKWQEACPTCTFEFSQISIPLAPESIKIQPWRLVIPQERPKGSFNIQVRVSDPKQSDHVFWVTGQVRIFDEAPVARKQLQLGERLLPDDIEFKKVDITFIQDTWPSKNEWSGRSLSQGLRAGDILLNSKLSRELAVKRGDLIRVNGIGDGFQVSMSGVAKKQAIIGDTIELENLETKKTLLGKVTGIGEVTVDFD